MIVARLTTRHCLASSSEPRTRTLFQPRALFWGFMLLWGLDASAAPLQLQSDAAYRNDQILVMPAPGVEPTSLDRFHVQQHTRVLGLLREAEGLQVVEVPENDNVASLVSRYRKSGLVKFAEPDYIRHLALTLPNDPLFVDGSLWGLNNYGQPGGTAHADIDAPRAWG